MPGVSRDRTVFTDGSSAHRDVHDTDSCSMNMLFTWSYENTCVIFRWWHIKTLWGLLISCLTVICLSMLYELLKHYIYTYDLKRNRGVESSRIYYSLLYSLQVAFSFFLMLVFMSYNGWLMASVAIGAAIGNYYCNAPLPQHANQISLACH
ncbi:hypothetical protein KAFR_0E02310 [Kazachstania africana CBS 2517]|uniref:Copper transport protein n=1 Tax=Kazachstania africana (strain ATCC 22294 / BCRC 22015 / CBS 2517 / CECT 1963 / NBRC 1671 / NRRL Y-8276) TaxID=1071382 RepID=H2AVI4_KAZAF|nr:hypothetical protein KAFR_0E02310 [Kazachstania africana CBS 2517]CCF58384.1 hypothetical protein KAFR_0E02310 [Kazachstania africana CBS 2517]